MSFRSTVGKLFTGALNRGRDPREFLLDMLPKESVCAEVGVWRGDFSALIMERVRPHKLYLIDPWVFESGQEYQEAVYGGGAATCQEDMDRMFDGVVRRFETPIEQGRVKIIRASSTEGGDRIPDESLDWVYIDGNHQYDFVLQDLKVFTGKLKKGGLLAGDDYGTKGWWDDGVTRAVDEFAATGACKVAHIRKHQFVLCKF